MCNYFAKVRRKHNLFLALYGQHAQIGRLVENIRVDTKKVLSECSTNVIQLLGVDCLFEEYLVYGADIDAYLLGEPGVGVSRAAQLVTDKVAYVYLHSVAICALGYRIHINTPTTTDKKKASNLVSCLRSWK